VVGPNRCVVRDAQRRRTGVKPRITELVFPDRAAFVDWIEKLSVEAIGADEERFLDRSRTRAYVIEERVTAG
jgi:hypothetical protein